MEQSQIGCPRIHSFAKGELHGCWQLVEDRQVNSRFVKALCTVCNKTIKDVEYSVLHRGTSKHCGCKGTKKDQVAIGIELKGFRVVEHKVAPIIVIECLVCSEQKDIDYTRFLRTAATKCDGCLVVKKDAIVVDQVYHDLKVLAVPIGRSVSCLCLACHSTTIVDYVTLLNGSTRSCGCRKTELLNQANIAKFGVPFYSQTQEFADRKDEIKKKARKAKQINGNIIVLKDGRALIEVCTQANVPPPFVIRLYHDKGEEVALRYIQNYTGSANYLEQSMIDLLKDTFAIEHYNKYPLEARHLARKPDFRIEQNNRVLYVNVDGLYWHCDQQKKDNEDHLKLHQSFAANHLNLFQFREDELYDKPNIVRSMICNYFGIFKNKYDARKCDIKVLSAIQASTFFQDNHLMGSCRASISYGLYYKTELVACMSIRNKEDSIELARFATQCHCTVRGGFSKLLKYIEDQHKPISIVSFCDQRYSTGQSYIKLGFSLESITLGWKWTDFYKTYNRLRCRANMDDRLLPEAAHAEELKWYKIYDAGQAKYVRKCQ